MTPTTQRTGGRRSDDLAPIWWSGLLPSAFVVLALIALVAVPRLIQRGGMEARAEVTEAADPARTLVTEVQYLLARQTSSLRGYVISRDSEYRDRYLGMVVIQDSVMREIAPLVERLGAEPLEEFVELRTLSDHWHAVIGRALRQSGEPGALLVGGELPDETLYQAALGSAQELDRAIVRATLQRRARIQEVERRAQWTQLVLALLALAAALTAARLGVRVHALALESEARRRESEQALRDLARAVESKSRLLRGVTHDVKNPLGAADAYADLLQMGLKGDLTEPQAAVVAGIRRGIRHALDILQDLLDLSRAESGALSVERELTSLTSVVREVTEDYRASADGGQHALLVELPSDAAMVYTDAGRVRQILGNLLSNAIKYTPPGGTLRVSVHPHPTEAPPRPGRWVCIRVADTGGGISPEDRERVFEEFARLTHAAAGHGLGLAISRQLARLLGGDITLQSEVGQGSCFTLWLPARGDGLERSAR